MAAQPTPGLAARLLALRLIERIDEEEVVMGSISLVVQVEIH